MTVLIRPIITEKYSKLSDDLKYGFVVHTYANKLQIKNAVERKYGVTVESVNTIIQNRKNKKRQSKSGIVEGSTSKVKKAIVKISDGDSIDFYNAI